MIRPHVPSDRRWNRRSLFGLLGGASMALAAGCAGTGTPDPGGSTAPQTWSFTDDVGRTVELPTRPTRIAGLTDAVAALWNLWVTPVASFGMISARKDAQFEGKDLSTLVEVGTSYGEIDLEKLAAQQPELIVTHAYPDGKGGLEKLLYGFADEAQLAKVEKIAPVVALAQRGPVDLIARRTSALALSLGISREALAAAEAEFTAAAATLRTAAAGGLSVLYLAGYPSDGVYVARASDDPALSYYTAELGLGYPKVGGSTFYWDHLSWEKVDTYSPDIVLASNRAMGPADLAKQPTFAELPVAKAGQVYTRAFYPTDHRGQATAMTTLAELLTKATKVSD